MPWISLETARKSLCQFDWGLVILNKILTEYRSAVAIDVTVAEAHAVFPGVHRRAPRITDKEDGLYV